MNAEFTRLVRSCVAMSAAVICTSAVLAQSFTLESAVVTSAADVLADKSILVVGQPVAGVMSNASFTIEVGQVPVLLASLNGDFNGDFVIDESDLPAFVDVLLGALTDPNAANAADMNGDGMANGEDIAAFVTAMLTL